MGWSHLVEIISLKDELQRDFYAEMCRIEGWSVRTLRHKISGMVFERTALSKKPVELAKKELAQLREEDKLTPDLRVAHAEQSLGAVGSGIPFFVKVTLCLPSKAVVAPEHSLGITYSSTSGHVLGRHRRVHSGVREITRGAKRLKAKSNRNDARDVGDWLD